MDAVPYKEVILLVGPQGSGKSTYCQTKLKDYYRISQDDMGKAQYWNTYIERLKLGGKIVIDRINHLYPVRKDFLVEAKAHGYYTKIIVMNYPYEFCYNRILNREDHPTLSNKDESKILDALSMYFSQYQYVGDEEADEVIRLTDYDPYILDLRDVIKNHRVILIGDPHGCYDEVSKLLHLVHYNKNTDIVIFTGDLIDRGKNIKELLDLLINSDNIYSVMSNHENKLLRYLRGNPVNISWIQDETLPQLKLESNLEYAKKLRMELESLPYAIRLQDKTYVVHAGINPTRQIYKQHKSNLIYARIFDPASESVTELSGKNWWEFRPYDDELFLFFGHSICSNPHVSDWVLALDGGMVMGGKARAYVMEVNGTESIHEIDSSFAYAGEKSSVGMHESLIPFEDLYNLGYLSKSEMENLVLYKYNDKTTYEKYWNEYTTAARGIVFNKYTGECVARPFPKFFNLGENEASNYKNLPLDQKYEVYDKLDGSCGILFWHNNKPCITTMGSFTSDQAIEATKIINNRYDISDLSRDITIIFEIIYPENKIVCDYKDTRDLFLLSAFNRHTGVELSRIKVKAIADKYGFPLVNKRKITIESAIKQQKTLPKDREGFVVRFANGLRVKIKGEEYLKIHKAISNMSPLSIWEAMENGKLKDSFKAQMPEELTKDIEIIEKQLSDQFHRTLKEIEYEVKIVGIPKELNPENRKKIGLFISENKERLIHPSAIFPFLLNQKQAIEKYIMNFIRPTGNKIKER